MTTDEPQQGIQPDEPASDDPGARIGTGRAPVRAVGLDGERRAARGGAVTALALGVLVLLSAAVTDRSGASDHVLALAAVLSTLMLLVTVLAVEGRAQQTGSASRGWAVLLVLLVLVVVVLLLSAWLPTGTRPALLTAVVVALLVGVAALVLLRRPPRRRSAEVPAAVPVAPTGGAIPSVAVACSGGGIRAAAFVLGGLNALQELPPVPEVGATPADRVRATGPTGPALVAVSGGSYTAASMSLVRRFPAGSDPRGEARVEPPLPWTGVLREGTPELHRLRRHTRDLFEPRPELVVGLLGWLMGAVVNLVILLGILLTGAWVVTWLASATGVVDDGLHLWVGAATGGLTTTRLWVFGPALLGLVVFLLAVGRVWMVRRRRDAASTQRATDRHGRSTVAMRLGAGGAVLWLALTLALPAAVTGLTWLTTHNKPTALVAGVLHDLGFATRDSCAASGGDQAVAAAAAARADAHLSPGEARAYSLGACGYSTTIELTQRTEGCDVCADVETPAEEWRERGAAAVAAGVGQSRDGAVAPLAAVLAAVGAALTAIGGSGSASAAEPAKGAAATLRRLLVAYLPPLVVVLLLAWLVLWRMQELLVTDAFSAPPGPALVLPPLLALACAAWQDANVTSMHSYYRARLSSAFAVGRTSTTPPTAEQLDTERYFRFSELGTVPLHITTTANVRAYEQAPTRRGGIPLTFRPDRVDLDGLTSLTARAYEDYAGHGRTSIMGAVAMSGAAVSPMAGRFAATVAPFRLLLTLLNVRIGVWVRNPLWLVAGDEPRSEAPRLPEVLRGWPNVPWLLDRPGSAQVVSEAFGRSSVDSRWLYLTDGGHLDNTGMVEAVRLVAPAARREVLGVEPPATSLTRLVVVLEASNDRTGTWTAVGDAVNVLGADLGIRLVRSDADVASPDTDAVNDLQSAELGTRSWRPWSTQRATTAVREYTRTYWSPTHDLEVVVVKAVRPLDVATSDLPESVRSFALTHDDFPRAATTRQDFGDLEFEAYRVLGRHYTLLTFAPPPSPPATDRPAADPTPHPLGGADFG